MLLSYYSHDESNKLVKSASLYQATPLFYINMPDGEKAPVFDFKNFPFEIFKNAPCYKKRGKTRDQINYINLACCFDIETSTIENTEKPYAFMYQWQYCIEDYVFMGKTWEEWQEFNAVLEQTFDTRIYEYEDNMHGKSLVCYIFNLQYEFMFMQHFMGTPINPLFTDVYEPLYIPTVEGITYRCAYRLTNKSLDQFTKGFPHHKLAGDLDYNTIRVPVASDPKNGLTDLELAYCYNDVKGCCEALRDRFEKDKYNIASIPLTSTGYVRKDCQRSTRKNGKWRKQFLGAQLSPELYEICRHAFRGGNTHTNYNFVGRLCGLPELGGYGGLVHHKDITSSYPKQILTKKIFPISPFKLIKELTDYTMSKEEFIECINKLSDNFCILFTLRLIGVKYIGACGVPYIPRSKSITRTQDDPEVKEDNGRIYEAPYIKLSCTEIDAKIIMRDYSIDKVVICSAYRAKKGMLPYELRRTVFEYYKIKCELSGSSDPDDKYNRARAKENLNACYGMMCQRLDHLDILYNEGNFKIEHHPLKYMIDKFYDSESSFLWYQWALWVTAGAREDLDRGMQACNNSDGTSDLLYIDTDSVFYIGDHEEAFKQLNAEIEAESLKLGIVASDKFGNSYPIGVWTNEHKNGIKLFKALGAKKYLLSEDGKTIESTIAGVSKDIGQKYFTEHGFDAFEDTTVIPVSGKVAAHYNNDKPHYIYLNGVKILTASNVALVNAAYTIKLKRDYTDFLKLVVKNVAFLARKS